MYLSTKSVKSYYYQKVTFIPPKYDNNILVPAYMYNILKTNYKTENYNE